MRGFIRVRMASWKLRLNSPTQRFIFIGERLAAHRVRLIEPMVRVRR